MEGDIEGHREIISRGTGRSYRRGVEVTSRGIAASWVPPKPRTGCREFRGQRAVVGVRMVAPPVHQFYLPTCEVVYGVLHVVCSMEGVACGVRARGM